MKNMMKYKNYYGSIDFSEEDMIFFGKIQFIRSLISYEGENAQEIINAFHAAVEDYLITCSERGVAPEQAFKGSFNVRVGEKMHEKLAISANQIGASINEFVKKAISHEIQRLSI